MRNGYVHGRIWVKLIFHCRPSLVGSLSRQAMKLALETIVLISLGPEEIAQSRSCAIRMTGTPEGRRI
jgi:hypothetical protein